MTNSSSEPPKRRSEFALIAELFAPLSRGAPGAFGLRDDAATMHVNPHEELVVTVDALVEGVHFFKTDPAADVAKKGLRVNLSDLAAKGATARHYLLALSLPDWVDDSWLESFAAGLGEDQEKFAVTLIGGDTTRTPGPLSFAITAMGTVPTGRLLRRSGAVPGDHVFVTGTIGDSGAGLALLKGEGREAPSAAYAYLVARYRLPDPRTTLGPRLLGLASAALDVSDGLLADLAHIAATSGVRLILDGPRIPLSENLAALWGKNSDAIARAATAGDDYEIAFTAPALARPAIAAAAKAAGVPVHEIGRIETGEGVILLDAGGAPMTLSRQGYTHF